MHRIDLVGINHLDSNIRERLWNAFNWLQPNIITLEYPNDQKGYMNFWNSAKWQKKLKEAEKQMGEKIFNQQGQLLMCLEEEYANEISTMQKIFEIKKVPLYPIDSLRARILCWQRIDITKALKSLKEISEGKNDDIYEALLIERHIRNNEIPPQLTEVTEKLKNDLVLTPDRENFQRDRIKTILEISQLKEGKLMHVGGIAHLIDIDGTPSLYRALKKSHPNCSINRHLAKDFDEAI